MYAYCELYVVRIPSNIISTKIPGLAIFEEIVFSEAEEGASAPFLETPPTLRFIVDRVGT